MDSKEFATSKLGNFLLFYIPQGAWAGNQVIKTLGLSSSVWWRTAKVHPSFLVAVWYYRPPFNVPLDNIHDAPALWMHSLQVSHGELFFWLSYSSPWGLVIFSSSPFVPQICMNLSGCFVKNFIQGSSLGNLPSEMTDHFTHWGKGKVTALRLQNTLPSKIGLASGKGLLCDCTVAMELPTSEDWIGPACSTSSERSWRPSF